MVVIWFDGPSAGFAQAIAMRFQQAGQPILAAGMDEDPDLPAQLAGAPVRRIADATPGADGLGPLDALAGEAAQHGGRLDAWVTCCGSLGSGAAELLSPADWEQALLRRLSPALWAGQAAGRVMLAQGRGVIVHVSDAQGLRPAPGGLLAGLLSAALLALTRGLGVEWAAGGVRVVGVTTAPPDAPPRRIPGGRAIAAREVAEAVVFLASDEAAYITAETMPADGGWASYQLF